MSLRISIITATKNRRDHLQRCIASVASQGYAMKEHVIVDGASTDGTVELLHDAALARPELRWISEPDSSLSEAFNKGLALATGDVFVVLGDDDILLPDALETVAAAFGSHPSAGIVAGGCEVVRDDGSVIATKAAGFEGRDALISSWRTWGKSTFLPAPSTYFRRETVEKVGGFNPADRYSMDFDHWVRITEHFEVVIVPEVLSRFRWDEGTITFSRLREQMRETNRISRRYWGRRGSIRWQRFLASYLTDRVKRRVLWRAIEALRPYLGRRFRR